MNYELITRLKAFEPYGLGNPTPIFMSKNIQISDVRKLGKLGQHLKFKAGNLEAVWFNVPSPSLELREGLGVSYDLTYQIEENTWNGQSKLQLVIKEVKSIHG
jgi:single-stranded-DNA-specific exonuclease